MEIPDWTLRRYPAEEAEILERKGFPALLARLLASRGVTAQTVEDYLKPAEGVFAKPGDLPGAEEAARVILESMSAGEEIIVFGDYDCDGICATAILVRTIKAFGGNVRPFIPRRLTEGYGMTASSMERLEKEHPCAKLVVTVDNGINSVEEVRRLKAAGVKVVVTDHHLPGDELPDCTIVNPKVSAPEELEWLCGSGVAFFVANALAGFAVKAGLDAGGKISPPLIVLAGIATVTDIMPLKRQNRTFVARALSLFGAHAPVGLKELMERAARTGLQSMCARDFGFLIGPRMNADGRLADGIDALNLVLADDREQAREYARLIDFRNTERKKHEISMMHHAMDCVAPDAPAQVIEIPDGHIGVAGIVAAKILEKSSADGSPVPVAIAVGKHGSARAPEGYNVRSALEESSAHLERFGGHAAAGGFSLKEGEFELFKEKFLLACAKQAHAAGFARGRTVFDAWVEGRDLTTEFVREISKMEPFGEGNPEPVFAIAGARFSSVKPFGQDGRHLLIEFSDRSIPKATWWNHGEDAKKLRSSSAAHDILFTVAVSTYGKLHVELRMVAVS